MTETEKKTIANRVRQLFFLSNVRDDKERIERSRELYKLFLLNLNLGYFDDKELQDEQK